MRGKQQPIVMYKSKGGKMGIEFQKEKHSDAEIYKSLHPLLGANIRLIFETSPPPLLEFFSYDLCVVRLKLFPAFGRSASPKSLMPPTHLASPEKNSINFWRRFGLVFQKSFDSSRSVSGTPEVHSFESGLKGRNESFYAKK